MSSSIGIMTPDPVKAEDGITCFSSFGPTSGRRRWDEGRADTSAGPELRVPLGRGCEWRRSTKRFGQPACACDVAFSQGRQVRFLYGHSRCVSAIRLPEHLEDRALADLSEVIGSRWRKPRGHVQLERFVQSRRVGEARLSSPVALDEYAVDGLRYAESQQVPEYFAVLSETPVEQLIRIGGKAFAPAFARRDNEHGSRRTFDVAQRGDPCADLQSGALASVVIKHL